MLRRLFLIASVCCLAALGRAAGADSAAPVGRLDSLLGGFNLGGERGPVRIDANTMEFDYKSMVLTYRGAVSVTQADLRLRSEVLRITLDPDRQGGAKEVVAEGNVQIDKGARRATGGRAVFDDVKRTVTLSEHARLRDGPNEVAGERVVVYLDQQRSIVEGGPERVRAVLYPQEQGGPGKPRTPEK
ncbi:MAG: lipopolysaccharide transport periplasmic protein LptA [Candidatus Binatia bacterium]